MKILVALDGSAAAFNALRMALRLAGSLGAYVAATFVNKAEEYTPEEAGWETVLKRMARELEAEGEEVLRQALEIGRQAGSPVERMMLYGNPYERIAEYVAAHGIVKLVAMGHSSKGRGAREFVESTTKNVILHTRAPVLVTSREVAVRRVMVAVEDAALAGKAARVAGKIAGPLGAEVTVVTAVPDAEGLLHEYGRQSEIYRLGDHLAEFKDGLTLRGERATAVARETLAACGIAPGTVTKEGEAAEEILAMALAHELTVIGVKRGTLRTKSLGSVAQRLLEQREVSTIFVQ